MIKHLIPFASLTFILCACELFSPEPAPDKPSVSAVAPEDNAANVSQNASIEAQLNLGSGAISLTSLTAESVLLEGPEGSVTATRRLEGDTLILDPNGDLSPNTRYTFSITEALETANGEGFSPFSSSFTTEEPTPLTLTLRNALGLPSDNRMVLFRINSILGNPCDLEPVNCDPTRWQSLRVTDSGSLALENTGTTPLTVSLSSSAPTLFRVNPESLTIAAGETATAEVTFVAKGLEKGVYTELVNATVDTQSVSLEVAGVYQTAPEGSRELTIGQLIEAFGYETDLGVNAGGFLSSDEVDSPKAGSEVRSQYWRAADRSDPVVVTQLAAFMPCCTNSPSIFDFELFARGSSTYFARLPYDPEYSQSILPRSLSGELPNRLSVRTGTTFRFDIAGYSSVPNNGFLGVRFWPLTDEEGNVVADSYIVAQDFARGPCGSDTGEELASNCDYNDHIYLVQNIEPVAPY